ncbi:MAG: hypothetical protein GVY20_10325 [Bacteroidetes bacterium]|jgi:2-phosphoglycerate kinase|nr:hypothetical protein [Bacteroidota bacterium]
MIEIDKNNNIFPFSKGILAQSILPTGLSIEKIYEIVREVEETLDSLRTGKER